MYWQEGRNIVQGRCASYEPVLRSNCEFDQKYMAIREFEDRLISPSERQVVEARQRVSTWQNEFYAIDRALRADPYNADLAAEWRYVKRQLQYANEALRCAEKAKSDATEALQMVLDRGVTYRVMWNNGRYDNVRPFVARFYEIFDRPLPPPPPSPPPPPPIVTWVDSNTGKTWGLMADQMTWDEANYECQRRPGWRLPLADQDFEVGDGTNLDVARRIYASSIGSTLSQLPYRPVSGGSDYQAKVVWTGDYTPSADYGALLHVFADINGHGLDRYLHLLSANSRYSVICVKD